MDAEINHVSPTAPVLAFYPNPSTLLASLIYYVTEVTGIGAPARPKTLIMPYKLRLGMSEQDVCFVAYPNSDIGPRLCSLQFLFVGCYCCIQPPERACIGLPLAADCTWSASSQHGGCRRGLRRRVRLQHTPSAEGHLQRDTASGPFREPPVRLPVVIGRCS